MGLARPPLPCCTGASERPSALIAGDAVAYAARYGCILARQCARKRYTSWALIAVDFDQITTFAVLV
jgi:hypothetical protein